LRGANLEILYGNTSVYSYFLSLNVFKENKKNGSVELRGAN
jgi:hypothetical protein